MRTNRKLNKNLRKKKKRDVGPCVEAVRAGGMGIHPHKGLNIELLFKKKQGLQRQAIPFLPDDSSDREGQGFRGTYRGAE